jgi:hypothetical protein
MSRIRTDTAIVMFGLTLLATTAKAQDDGGDHTCDKAAKIVARGKPEKKELWAFAALVSCSGGAATVASAWNSPPADTDAFHALAAASYSVADHRILTAVLGVVRNTGISSQQRRVAINVALSQFSPSLAIPSYSWANPATAILGHQSDYHQLAGDQPVTAADRQAVVDALRSLGSSDPDPVLQQVAARVAMALARYL